MLCRPALLSSLDLSILAFSLDPGRDGSFELTELEVCFAESGCRMTLLLLQLGEAILFIAGVILLVLLRVVGAGAPLRRSRLLHDHLLSCRHAHHCLL